MPYTFHSGENAKEIPAAKQAAIKEILSWNVSLAVLYQNADKDHVNIKRGKVVESKISSYTSDEMSFRVLTVALMSVSHGAP